MSDVKLAMQFGHSQFNAEGPPDFVNKMLERWTELAADQKFSEPVVNKPTPSHASDTTSAHAQTSQYENVYDEVDGSLKIIANIPGANKAARARGVTLVLLYGKFLHGETTATADSIRDACIDQGCYDSSNFAHHLKGLKDRVAMNTKPGGGYDVKLTAPGRKAAQELVEHLNNGTA